MDIFAFLDQHRIPFEHHQHEAVYTCDQANALLGHLGGARIKNLFLRDKKGQRHFLVVVPDEKRVDLKELAEALDTSRLSMGSPDRLLKYLGITPGSVSLLSLLNDHEGKVELVMDSELAGADALQCHPLVNTATLVVPMAGVQRFLAETGHIQRVVEVPGAIS